MSKKLKFLPKSSLFDKFHVFDTLQYKFLTLSHGRENLKTIIFESKIILNNRINFFDKVSKFLTLKSNFYCGRIKNISDRSY